MVKILHNHKKGDCMYTVKTIDDVLVVSNDDMPILSEIRPCIHLDNGKELVAEFKKLNCFKRSHCDGEYDTYDAVYTTPYEEAHMTIRLDVYANKIVASATAALPIDSFKDSFHPISSIELNIKNVDFKEGFLSSYLFSKWWSRPQFGKNIAELMPKTQSVLWKDSFEYHHLLPLCDDKFKTEFSGRGNSLIVSVCPYYGGLTSLEAKMFVMSKGTDPFEVTKTTTETGFQVLNSHGKAGGKREIPEMFNYLGWCTWDAFYHEVNSDKIIKKASEFKGKNIPVKWLMIDDGWSETKEKKLNSFQEDKKKFPDGLRETVRILKERYEFTDVGVWQAFTGYWQGIYPESELAIRMKESLYNTASQRMIPSPERQKGFSFWNEWHEYLKKQGISFVKVDNQSALLDFVKYQIPIGEAAKYSHESLEASVALHFNGKVINCMGMSMEQLWHRPMTSLSRNSDDFYPNKEQNFKEHALQNAYNSLYHRNFIHGDWDMWWTRHEHAKNNAVLRAVSGGPIYTSDPIGETDADQLWPLILADGRVLRCEQNGVPTEDCLFQNPSEKGVPLKIWNKSNDSMIIASFNINQYGKKVKGEIGPQNIPFVGDSQYILYDHFKRKTYILDKDSYIPITLKDNEVSLFLLTPIREGFAVCGLLNKYVSPAAIEKQYHIGEKLIIVLKGGGGLFGFYSEEKPKGVLVDGEPASLNKLGHLYTVNIESKQSEVLIEII